MRSLIILATLFSMNVFASPGYVNCSDQSGDLKVEYILTRDNSTDGQEALYAFKIQINGIISEQRNFHLLETSEDGKTFTFMENKSQDQNEEETFYSIDTMTRIGYFWPGPSNGIHTIPGFRFTDCIVK